MARTLTMFVSVTSIIAAGTVFAMSSPKLPPSAKKLTGKEIVALYDGLTIKFDNFTMAQPLTGTDTYDFKTKTHKGTYTLGAESGSFTGKIRVNGNLFCHREGKGKETCSSVYTDGTDIYETDAKGIVQSVNHKQ